LIYIRNCATKFLGLKLTYISILLCYTQREFLVYKRRGQYAKKKNNSGMADTPEGTNYRERGHHFISKDRLSS
jgi:hypothetical protein